MWEGCKVVMLPTNQKAYKNCILKSNGKLRIHYPEDITWINHDVLQHLYILSDEGIKEGDWCVHLNMNKYGVVCIAKTSDDGSRVYHEKDVDAKEEYGTIYGGLTPLDHEVKKIIASTDSSLGILILGYEPGDKDITKQLPSPSQSFIEKYVSEYNRGNIITEVMVEYEGFDNLNSMNDSSILGIIPKINPEDNTITIKEIKDNWSREELNKEAIKFYKKYHGILNQGDMQSIAKFIDEL